MTTGRPRRYESPEERKAADAERKRLARQRDVDPDLPVVDVNLPEPELAPGSRSIETLLKLDPFAPLTDEEEHILRVHFGYAASERRTRAERQAVANRIVSKLGKTANVTTRYKMDGTPVEEKVGASGLSLIAYPVQSPNDLAVASGYLKASKSTDSKVPSPS